MFNQIDIHGCTTIEAKIRHDNYLNSLSPNTKEITVVHGYSSKILQQFIRKQYKHKRAGRRILTMNAGRNDHSIKIRSFYGKILSNNVI